MLMQDFEMLLANIWCPKSMFSNIKEDDTLSIS